MKLVHKLRIARGLSLLNSLGLENSPIKSVLLLVCVFFSIATGSAFTETEDYWQQFKSGKAIILMRHALAPGTGDPANFDVNDCSTQRNLSVEGEQQSVHIGDVIKSHGVEAADLYSSTWCRCIDTANKLGLGEAEPLPLLNSFFREREKSPVQTEDLTKWITRRLELSETNPKAPAVLVSHQVNITALSNVYPSSGEMVFIGLDDGNLVVLGQELIQ